MDGDSSTHNICVFKNLTNIFLVVANIFYSRFVCFSSRLYSIFGSFSSRFSSRFACFPISFNKLPPTISLMILCSSNNANCFFCWQFFLLTIDVFLKRIFCFSRSGLDPAYKRGSNGASFTPTSATLPATSSGSVNPFLKPGPKTDQKPAPCNASSIFRRRLLAGVNERFSTTFVITSLSYFQPLIRTNGLETTFGCSM